MQIAVPTRKNTSQHSEGPLQRFVIHLPTKRDRHANLQTNDCLARCAPVMAMANGTRAFLGCGYCTEAGLSPHVIWRYCSVRIRKMINYNRLYATELKFSRLGLITTYSHAVCRCIGVSIRGLREFGEPTCWVEMMHHALSSPDLPAGSCLIRRFLRGISHLDL